MGVAGSNPVVRSTHTRRSAGVFVARHSACDAVLPVSVPHLSRGRHGPDGESSLHKRVDRIREVAAGVLVEATSIESRGSSCSTAPKAVRRCIGW